MTEHRGDAAAVFDINQLMTATQYNQETAKQIVSYFLGEVPKQLHGLGSMLEIRDLKTAERIAHSIKGNAATIGCFQLSETALGAERCCRDGDAEEASRLLAPLERQIGEARTILLAMGFSEDPARPLSSL